MKKRILSIFLCFAIFISSFPMSVFAEGAAPAEDHPVTKNVSPLLVSIELVDVTPNEDGLYNVEANQPYNIKLTFAENDSLEMDMTDFIYFELPIGSVAPIVGNIIEIGVDDGSYHHIYHDYTIQNNILTITWNKDSEYFEDLARAHDVTFEITIQTEFDGTSDEVKFNTETDTVVKVDNTGSITINKVISGLRSDVVMTDAQK